jgi:Domain of unknown function (DUF3850)
MSKRQEILNTIEATCSKFLYYDRKNDEDLRPNDIKIAVMTEDITMDEIIDAFRKHIADDICNCTHHRLKLQSKYWDDVKDGTKAFEVRKNDRGFKVGDLVTFKLVWETGIEGGVTMEPKVIKYVLQGGQYGISDEYCVIGF